MPIQAIAYSSQAVQGLTLDDVERLTADSAAFNHQCGVTGVLLFDGQRFMQYIEGPDECIDQVYARILGSRRHLEIMELGRGMISARRFPDWSMQLVPAGAQDLRMVVLGDWNGFARSRSAVVARTGVDRLMQVISPQVEA